MQEALQFIHNKQTDYQKMILKNITNFIYREERYSTPFAVMLIYLHSDKYVVDNFSDILRKTDLYIDIDTHVKAIVFDSVSNDFYIKAAENIEYKLETMNIDLLYSSVVDSENYSKNYTKMAHDLVEILEYAIENNFSNVVLDNDESDLL